MSVDWRVIMIGQKEVLKQIDNLIEKGFPRFVVITGQKGQGKTELAKYISKKLNIQMIEIGIKIDDIREMIEMAYKQTEPIIYLIQNADKMSLGAKNSLLKVIEEPPNNAIFIMELQQMENTLETIKSRCQEIKMEAYLNEDIYKMINKVNPSINEDEIASYIVQDIARNYYQVELFNKYGITEFYNYVRKVIKNIYRVSSANSFKLAEKLDLKDDGNGYDLNLFFETFKSICLEESQQLLDNENEKQNFDSYLTSVEITSKYQQKLNINGINKRNVDRPMDNFYTKGMVTINLFEIQKPLQTIEEKIKQRRLQMLVHSYIYYELDKNIIDDYTWSKWAVELVQLQKENPIVSKQVEYYEQFKDWDGSTGAFLKYDDKTRKRAERLLKINGIK